MKWGSNTWIGGSLVALAIGVALTAMATAAAGPVIFVALAAPQIARRLTGATGPGLAAAGLTGAVLLSGSDRIAERALPSGPVPVGVVAVEQVRCVGGAADQEVAAVDGEIEVAAAARFGALVAVAGLSDRSDAELLRDGGGDGVVLDEVQPQVVQVGAAHGVGPPQIRLIDGECDEISWAEGDFAILPGLQCHRLGHPDR